MANKPSLGPLTLEPRLIERMWGESRIHDWYPQPTRGKPIGEVWLTAEECLVKGSADTLKELAARYPAALDNERGEGFPLLIKLLYPREKLSVQVHPNDEQAISTLGQPRGKTECWYVLSAEPGAQVAIGFHDLMDASEIGAAISEGTLESKLRYIAVKVGDMVFVDAGTVHAIGPGMVVLETQQYSDVTYRLWDYGRPRELHLEAGLAVARATTAAGLVPAKDMDGYKRLIDCRYFTVDSFKFAEARNEALGNRLGLQILIAMGGGASVASEGSVHFLRAGCAVLLPDEDVTYTLSVPAEVEVVRIFRARG